jgi:hypothetical protein
MEETLTNNFVFRESHLLISKSLKILLNHQYFLQSYKNPNFIAHKTPESNIKEENCHQENGKSENPLFLLIKVLIFIGFLIASWCLLGLLS